MSANQTWRPAPVPILTRRPGDDREIESIAFSPRGGRLATLSSAGEVVVWDVASARIVGEAEGGGSIAFSPDGALLATGRGECACVYDTATWQRIREFPRQGHPVNCVAFAPSGEVVAAGDYRKFLLWDVAAGRVLARLRAHHRVVGALTFSPDGKTLASRSFDDMTLWDTTTGRALCAIAGLQGPTCDGCFAPDGKSVVSGQDRTSLARWTLQGTRGVVFQDSRARGYFLSARYSPDGGSLATGGQDEMVHLWDP
jgi:WD40 repeat protein